MHNSEYVSEKRRVKVLCFGLFHLFKHPKRECCSTIFSRPIQVDWCVSNWHSVSRGQYSIQVFPSRTYQKLMEEILYIRSSLLFGHFRELERIQLALITLPIYKFETAEKTWSFLQIEFSMAR